VQPVIVPQTTVDGYTTNDIQLDFTGNLRGQQMILNLTAGSIFQQAAFGGNTAPNGALFPSFADVEYDTFVTIGGLRSDGPKPPASQDLLVIGGAVDLMPGSALKFDTSGLNVAWAPAPGVDVDGGTGYVTSRITLSNDAQGTFQYFGSTAAGTGEPIMLEGSVAGGMILLGGPDPVVDDLVLDPIDVIGGMSMGTVTGSDVDTWSADVVFDSYTPGFGAGPAAVDQSLAPVFDTDTLKFSWDSTGAYPGTYKWLVSGSNGNGSDTGLVSVELRIPEPASLALFGLALVGFVGCRRK
jgi:hypothetical protein